jgi:hypothetical protein
LRRQQARNVPFQKPAIAVFANTPTIVHQNSPSPKLGASYSCYRQLPRHY